MWNIHNCWSSCSSWDTNNYDKRIPVYYPTQTFITLFTWPCNSSLSLARCIHPTFTHPVSLRFDYAQVFQVASLYVFWYANETSNPRISNYCLHLILLLHTAEAMEHCSSSWDQKPICYLLRPPTSPGILRKLLYPLIISSTLSQYCHMTSVVDAELLNKAIICPKKLSNYSQNVHYWNIYN
jgi:hypothetical protein